VAVLELGLWGRMESCGGLATRQLR